MQKGQGRPVPVSCQSCRWKKLKCNRAQPCSNCSARGITCNFLVAPPSQPETNSPTPSYAELLARIERLESVAQQTPLDHTYARYASDEGHLAKRQAVHARLSGVTVADNHQDRDEDSDLLENVGTRDDTLLPSLSHGISFTISSMQDFHGTRTYLQQTTPVSEHDRLNETTVKFPVHRVAVLLMQSYESNVDHVCRILHIPTIRSLIRTFYVRLSQSEPVLPGQAALLLSIFAIAAFFYQPSDNSEVATNQQQSIHLSKVLGKAALDVLDHSRRTTSGTVEDVQAYVLMAFVTFHLDGFSARGRLLSMTATSVARELCLHRVDADLQPGAENKMSVRALIDREVKRRVFWYIASTDWLLASISGPQAGMYFIRPDHVNVRLPIDCNDDDFVLCEGGEPIMGPLPTGMTYFHERVRLAHLCREMVDMVPLETSKLEQMPYDHIISLDQKLVDFISSLPFFFRLDAESREQTKVLESIYPYIPLLRFCITRAAHSRRCKLHQRFLLRQSSDPRYAYSRRACLESARVVIQFYDGLAGPDHHPRVVSARMGIAVHFMHLALVVLVMDLCFNRDAADEAEIKAEVRAGLQMFEDTRHISPLLGRFLSSLYNILQKHNVYLNDHPSTLTPHRVAGAFDHDTNSDVLDSRWHEHRPVTTPGLEYHDLGDGLDISFDDFWQDTVQGEPNLDLQVWDGLFSALDSRPL